MPQADRPDVLSTDALMQSMHHRLCEQSTFGSMSPYRVRGEVLTALFSGMNLDCVCLWMESQGETGYWIDPVSP
jgi:hypothetical protein